MTSSFYEEACESWSLASRIDQTQSQSQPGRGSERLDWQRRGYDTTECCRSDPGAAPAPGAPTPGLTSGAVSHRGQGKVPGCIFVEGIDFYSERSLTR